MTSERLARVGGGLRASAIWICVLACCSLNVERARAQEAPKVEEGTGEYRTLIAQAMREWELRNWLEARAYFKRAHELNPNARTLRGMGAASYELRDYTSAIPELSAALVDTRQPLTEQQRKESQTYLDDARSFVGLYTLTVEPAEATLRLDQAEVVRDVDGRVVVPGGEHTLHASAPGYQESVSKLSVKGGERGELRVVLYRPTVAAARPVATLEKSVSEEAPAPRARRVGGLRYSYVALGATAALGAAAIATWFVGQGKVDDLDASCSRRAAAGNPCVRGGVDTDSVKRFEHTTTALLALTGVGLVGTVVLASFEWPREERSLALDVTPTRVSLRGSF